MEAARGPPGLSSYSTVGHQTGHFLTDHRCEGNAHTAHAYRAKDVVVDGFYDRHFFAAPSHDTAPPMFDGILFAGQDDGLKESFELVLNGIRYAHLPGCLGFEGFV